MYSRNSSRGAQKSSAIQIFPFISPQDDGLFDTPIGSSIATGCPREVMIKRFPARVCRNSRAKFVFAAKAPIRVGSGFFKLVDFTLPV